MLWRLPSVSRLPRRTGKEPDAGDMEVADGAAEGESDGAVPCWKPGPPLTGVETDRGCCDDEKLWPDDSAGTIMAGLEKTDEPETEPARERSAPVGPRPRGEFGPEERLLSEDELGVLPRER
jgi:hypothetical protein